VVEVEQTGAAVVRVETGEPLAVCVPLVQVYCCVTTVKVGTVPPLGHCAVVAGVVPLVDDVVRV
jgi:hypothetical protein